MHAAQISSSTIGSDIYMFYIRDDIELHIGSKDLGYLHPDGITTGVTRLERYNSRRNAIRTLKKYFPTAIKVNKVSTYRSRPNLEFFICP